MKLNFGQDFEVKVYIQGFAFKSDLFNNFEAGASPKEDFLLKINITLIEAWDVVKSENVLLDPNSEL